MIDNNKKVSKFMFIIGGIIFGIGIFYFMHELTTFQNLVGFLISFLVTAYGIGLNSTKP